MLKALTNALESAVGSLTVGSNLFAGERPRTAPDACVTLLERVGGPVDPMDTTEQTRIVQVLARAGDYFACHTLAWLAFDALVKAQNVNYQLSENWWLYSIAGRSNPASIGQDAKGRSQFSANLTVRIRKET